MHTLTVLFLEDRHHLYATSFLETNPAHSSSSFFPLFRHPSLILQTKSHMSKGLLSFSTDPAFLPNVFPSSMSFLPHHYRSPSIPLFSVCLCTDGRSSWAGPEGEREKLSKKYPCIPNNKRYTQLVPPKTTGEAERETAGSCKNRFIPHPSVTRGF